MCVCVCACVHVRTYAPLPLKRGSTGNLVQCLPGRSHLQILIMIFSSSQQQCERAHTDTQTHHLRPIPHLHAQPCQRAAIPFSPLRGRPRECIHNGTHIHRQRTTPPPGFILTHLCQRAPRRYDTRPRPPSGSSCSMASTIVVGVDSVTVSCTTQSDGFTDTRETYI